MTSDRKFHVDKFVRFFASGRSPWKGIAGIVAARRSQNAVIQAIEAEFDSRFYLEIYPEVRASGLSPIEHYVEIGWREGKSPSPEFNTSYYLAANADVRAAGMNPLYHFIRFGRGEGRISAKHGDDLPSAGGGSFSDASIHAGQLDSEYQIVELEFDKEFYLNNDPTLRADNVDPIRHFLLHGWRELRDPSLNFSTSYYLDGNVDIKMAGLNPFVHFLRSGRSEGRQPLPFMKRLSIAGYNPLVSVVVPNYNHAKYLPRRLDSILDQTYKNVEILILDDCSQDDSATVIRRYVKRFPERIRAIFNKKNSGSVFAQWRKGFQNTAGQLIWICESDDFCEPRFLERLVPQFADPSVMLGFGRIQFADANGKPMPGLDSYRENAEHGIWEREQVRCAGDWFCNGFGVSNIIANVGGSLLRRQDLPEGVWKQAEKFRVVGDWYLYIMLASGGRIAYAPGAVAYFRQHGGNTSVKGFHTREFYSEQQHVLQLLRKRWGVPKEIADRFYERARQSYDYSKAEQHVGSFERLLSVKRAMAVPRTQRHILIAMLGFSVGGGEIFAIHLANALLKSGYLVSVLCLASENANENLRKLLDARIPVYDSHVVREIGVPRFLADAGVDLINSHYVGLEYFFFVNNKGPIRTPYVVTLHGSYEVSRIGDSAMLCFVRSVTHWVYLAEKNLAHLHGIPISRQAMTKIGNAMPDDFTPFPQSRKDLGIAKNDIVFAIVSRAIKEKGWEEAILALEIAQKRSSRKLFLLLCGSGVEADRLQSLHGSNKQVKFLGFQSAVRGLYGISDCALLPSRFQGESFPLSLIQAMQAGKPIISSDIGSIKSMITLGRRNAGLLVETVENDIAFTQSLADAMIKMVDDKFRDRKTADAKVIGVRYGMSRLVKSYSSLFDRLIKADSEKRS